MARNFRTALRVTVILLAIAAILYGFDRLLTFDHRREIAMTLLFPEQKTDIATLGGAISARFSNQPTESLSLVIQSLGGSCGISNLSPGTIECSIPVAGIFCLAERISVVGDVVDGKVINIRTTSYNANC